MTRTIAGVTAATVVALSALGTTATISTTVNGARFEKPVEGARISQPFGCTSFGLEPIDLHCPRRHWHSGIDLVVAPGAPVRATMGGVVTVIADRYGYGLHIVIDHGQGLSSLYAHLQSVDVASGDDVTAGQLIATVGSTGNSSGAHLHFEIRRDGIAEDPQLDLSLP